MTEEQLHALAYNAHEAAENAALVALQVELRKHSVEALACLVDPEWRWETRGWMSAWIIEYADAVLDEKLDEAVGFKVSAAGPGT